MPSRASRQFRNYNHYSCIDKDHVGSAFGALLGCLILYIKPASIMDRISKSKRRALMRRVRIAETTPEIAVAQIVRSLRFVFETNVSDLRGKPDIVLRRQRKVIFVHGCFWHSHACPRGSRPTSNREFWKKKLETNRMRDRRTCAGLRRQGWSVATVWECNLKNPSALKLRIKGFLAKR